MGRGDRQSSAQRSARSLLFGPRLGRELSPEAKKKRTIEKRKMTMQSRQKGHANNLINAAQSLIDGDHEPLAALMEEETPKGAIGAEKKTLREMAKMISQGLPRRSYASKQGDDKPLPGGADALDAMQALRSRAYERQMPDRAVNDPLFGATSAQAQMLINEQFTQKIKDNLDEIGELPKCMMVGFYWHLMGPDGNSLCGEAAEENPRNEPCSIINAGTIHCQQCEEQLKNKAPLMTASPAEIADEVDNLGVGSIGHYALSWRQPSASMTAAETIELGLKNSDARLREHCADFGINLPKAFDPQP